jgi:hypothetical protein
MRNDCHHVAASSKCRRSVCRPLYPIGESCAILILTSSLNGVTPFGRSHQGGDERTRASSRSIDQSTGANKALKGPTDHCGSHDDEDDDYDDETTKINVIHGLFIGRNRNTVEQACPYGVATMEPFLLLGTSLLHDLSVLWHVERRSRSRVHSE